MPGLVSLQVGVFTSTLFHNFIEWIHNKCAFTTCLSFLVCFRRKYLYTVSCNQMRLIELIEIGTNSVANIHSVHKPVLAPGIYADEVRGRKMIRIKI